MPEGGERSGTGREGRGGGVLVARDKPANPLSQDASYRGSSLHLLHEAP